MRITRAGFCFTLVAAATVLAAVGHARNVETAVIIYGLDRVSEESYQRILTSPHVRYVCFQQVMPAGPVPELGRRRCAELARAGKRNIVQIWWGPSRPYPWSKYSYANIALDPAVREDFWREVVDRCIDEFGPQNLYGAHLQEETGMQFGTDVQKREDPDDFETFEDDGKSYDHPFYSGWNKKWPGGPDIPNVKRHEADFQKLVGFGFENWKEWQPLQRHLFTRWVSTRLQSGGQVEFAKHIHEKYKRGSEGKLRAFTWDGMLWGGENCRADHRLEGRYFDGVLSDVYSDPSLNYYTQRAYRLLYPDNEIIHFAWGGMGDQPTTIAERRQHTLAAYSAGHDVLGIWSSPADYNDPKVWEENTDLFARLRQLPVMQTRPRLLVISARVSDIYSMPYSLNGLTQFDILPIWEAHDVDLSPYDTLVLDTVGSPGETEVVWDAQGLAKKHYFPGLLDYRRINDFIRKGGAMVIRGNWRWTADCPLFPVSGGFLHSPEGGPVQELNFAYEPEGWWQTALGLSGRYAFGRSTLKLEIDKPEAVQSSPAATFFRYGKGACLMIPYHRNYDRTENYGSEAWLSHRQLMTDLIRGFLRHVGKEQTARQCLADPALGNNYRRAVSVDGLTEAWYLFHLKFNRDFKPIPLQGTDVLTGTADPQLSTGLPAVVITRKR